MSNILTGFNMQGNDPIDDRIVSKSNLETLEQYLNRVPVQKRYYGLTFFALDKNNELRKYTFQTSLIEPTIDDYKELQEHVSDKAIHKTSEEIRSEIVDADIPDTIARVQWTLDQINTAVINLIGGASDEYNTLKRIQTKIEELRAKIYGDDEGTVLKTLEQALKFLNQYKDFIVDIPENFVNKQDIVDNLTTDDPTKVLSAKQGKVLSDTLTNYFESAMQSIRTETDRAINAENRIETKLDKEIDRSIKEDQRIDAKLDAEIKRSTDEDLRIDSKLDSEINRSTTEDDRLDKKIDAETTRATTVESNLNTKIETETDRAESEESRIETKLDNEIARSTNKDTEHDNRLTALEGDTHEQNTDLGTTNSTFQLKYNTGNKIKHESDAISVRNAADTDYVNFIAKNATFKGDLLVEGQSFVTEAETVEIKDNLLLLNKGEVGAGVTKGIAGLEIDRGTEPNYFIIFDESDSRFKAGVEGDLWNLALRESDDNMLDGYFISWNSKDKILSTTNIVNESTPLLFGRTDYKQYSGNRTDPDGNYSSYAFISEAEGNHLYNFSGSSNWNIDTDKINFRFWKPLLGTTFKRASDNSEVLYHADIVNNLTSGGTNKVLSAEQGKLLQNSITSIQGSYLPLSGGTMTGSIIFPNRKGIFGTLTNGTSNIKIAVINANNNVEIGNSNTPLMLVSNSTDLTHYRDNNTYEIWDKFNLSDPATSTDLANYLPLIGGTLTGQLTIKQSVDIKLRLQSTDADNHCIIQAINAQASQLGVFGYAGDKWAIGHNGTYYEIWDKYNLTNPVTYTTDTYNYATLRNKDGQYFTYIKAGTNGLLPHSQATLTNGGAGLLGTSDWSFNSAYINHVHTNKITFGGTGPYITGSTSATQFLNANGGVQKVATGGLYVGPSYASDALNLVPANGIYSGGIIYIENGIGFRNSIWTNDLTPNKNYSGYLQVLDAYDASSAGGPTNYGTVLQVNSRNAHWANQLWFSGGAEASKNGLYYRHMAHNQTEYGEWNRLLTNKDVNIIQTQSSSNPSTLPANQIFYSEIKGVAGTPTVNGSLFSVQGDDEGIQLWASSSRTELYYRTKWTSFGNWIKLATTSDLNSYLTKTEASTLWDWSNITNKRIDGSDHTSPKDCNNSLTNGIYYYDRNGPTTSIGASTKDGALFHQKFSDTWIAQIAQDYRNGNLFVRGKNNGTWTAWKKVALTSDISSISGYATQTWANGQFAPLSRFNTSTGYTTIKVTGQEFNFDSTNPEIFMNYRTLSGSAAVTKITWKGGSNSTLCEGRWGNLYMNDNLVATQSWAAEKFPNKTGTGASGTWGISISGNATTATTASKLGSTTIGGSAKPIYLSSGTPTACSATVGSATVPVYMNAGTITQCSTTLGVSITGNAATATNATQLGGTAASSYVKANDNISRLTNDSGYTTQEWVNGQGFLTSDSILDKFVPTTGGYIRNSDQVLLRLQRTGVSTGTSRTIEMYFDDSNTDGTSTTPRGSIGYNSEVGMFLYSAASKKFLAMEYTGRPFYGTPENRYYLLGSNTQYHNLDGYQRIGDIMIQWGYFTVQGNSTRAVNFPVSFTNTVWSVTGSWDNTTTGNQENWGFADYTSSGFTIINGDGSSRVFHYIAIGPFTRS